MLLRWLRLLRLGLPRRCLGEPSSGLRLIETLRLLILLLRESSTHWRQLLRLMLLSGLRLRRKATARRRRRLRLLRLKLLGAAHIRQRLIRLLWRLHETATRRWWSILLRLRLLHEPTSH